MEVNGNPWNLSRLDRAAWSDGLGIAMLAAIGLTRQTAGNTMAGTQTRLSNESNAP